MKDKQFYLQEIQYQSKMLKRLKRWLQCSIIFSSLFCSLLVFHHTLPNFVWIIAMIGFVASILISLIIGLAIKNGSVNLNKIMDYIS